MPKTIRDLANQCGRTPQYMLRYLKSQGLDKTLDKSGRAFLVPDRTVALVTSHFAKEGKAHNQRLTSSNAMSYLLQQIEELKADKERLEKENERLFSLLEIYTRG